MTDFNLTKTVCQLDENGVFMHQTTADLDLLENNGSYLIPAGCIDAPAPEIREGHAARWDGSKWEYLPDFRGQIAYKTADGQAVLIEKVGDLTDGVTLTAPPSDLYDWQADKWVINTERATEKKNARQSEMWERIKEKRYENLRGGVYVKSVDKWFHSNDESRQQYIFMRTMDNLPPNIKWKTMDNSFILMTKEILDELSIQLLLDEQADFATAEKHRAAMLKADDPLNYDFSSGWTLNFNESQ